MTTGYLWTLAGALFMSELLMLVALGGSVWVRSGHGPVGVAFGVAVVAAAVVLWALFASPDPIVDSGAAKAAVKIGLYVLAAVLLAAAGARTPVVWGFAVFSLVVNIAAVLPPYRDF